MFIEKKFEIEPIERHHSGLLLTAYNSSTQRFGVNTNRDYCCCCRISRATKVPQFGFKPVKFDGVCVSKNGVHGWLRVCETEQKMESYIKKEG